jgi:hypothetical protein
MKINQYLVLIVPIVILSSYGTVRADNWKDDIRGVNSSEWSLARDNYFGLRYNRTTFSADTDEIVDFNTTALEWLDYNPTALVARFGIYVAENVSIEGRYGFGVAHDSITSSGIRVDSEINYIFSVYGVVYADLSANVQFMLY